MVVYGRDGMDEVSLGAATMVGELKNGEVLEYDIHPSDFGMTMYEQPRRCVSRRRRSRCDAAVGCWPTSDGPVRDIVLLNAGAALYAANVAARWPKA